MEDPTPLFPVVPEDLGSLSDPDLATLATDFARKFAAIKARDPEALGDRTMAQIIETSKEAKTAYGLIKAEQKLRAEAEESFDSELETLSADIEEIETLDAAETTEVETAEIVAESETVETLESETSEGAETETTEEETETEAAVVASTRRPLPRPTRRHAPAPVETEVATGPQAARILAAPGLRGIQAGTELDRGGLDDALCAAVNGKQMGRTVFAHSEWATAVPEGRQLSETDAQRNQPLIAAAQQDMITETFALIASGQGNCAPLEPYYPQWDQSVANRPVRDALVGFTAARGGITYQPPFDINEMVDNGAVGNITEADQAAGGTFATKTCAVIQCNDIVSVNVDQIYKCLQFGNLQSRAYPEFVAQQNNLAISQWARFADGNLLDTIHAGSTKVNGLDQTGQGAVSNYFGDLLTLAAGVRSNLRLSADVPMQGIAPAWLRDMLVLDIVRSQFMRFDQAQAQIQDLLARYRINMSWTLDSRTGGNQVFPVQDPGGMNMFNATVETALFPAGSWLFLDAGTLDLGIVRDSTLNAINAYQLFAETFEEAALVGPVSYWITSTLCPTGAVTAPDATTTAWCA